MFAELYDTINKPISVSDKTASLDDIMKQYLSSGSEEQCPSK